MQIFTQIVAENINKDTIKIFGIASKFQHQSIFDEMKNVVSVNLPGIEIKYETVEYQSLENIVKDADVLLAQNLSNNNEVSPLYKKKCVSN